ncbi:hypothetical protein GQ42DRAFT_159755 [Ramicandelaber brevisporus]|nr:hypothetical protein GQ42DRAFT_159755 [Ramicandelaber brevisporus]
MHLPQATSPKSFWSESEYPASTSSFSTLEKLFYGNTSAARILDKLVSINPTRRAHVDEYDIDTFTAGIHEMISTNTIDAAVRYLGNLYPEVAVIHPDYSTGLFIDKDLPVYYGHNSYYSIPPDYQRCHDKLTEFGTKYARWIVVVICYNAHVTGLIVDVDGANVYYLNSAGDGDLVERLMYSNFPQQHVNNMINFMVPAVRNRQPQPAMSNDCGMMFWLYILAFLAGGCDPHAISTFRIRGYEGYHDYSTKAASKYLRSIMRLAALSVLNDPYYISKYTGDVQYA